MNKRYYHYVFVILVYRNSDDLISCLRSIEDNVENYRVIIVNSYFDEYTKNQVEMIAKSNKCDFLNVKNNGYGAGNNRGIEFVCKNYEFEYVIVSNPDIIIDSMLGSPNVFAGMDIIAPKIVTLNRKNQNPILVLDNKISDFCLYLGYRKKWDFLVLFGFAINKIIRELFLIFNKEKIRQVYGAHGSFVMFSKKALLKLTNNPYDENIFLFSEEFVIANKAKKNSLATFYYPKIKIIHKEDGSIKLSNISENEHLSKSSIYYFEKYRNLK